MNQIIGAVLGFLLWRFVLAPIVDWLTALPYPEPPRNEFRTRYGTFYY